MSDSLPVAANADEQICDRRYMEAALSLGRRWLGLTAPNPAVGALLVKNEIVVGCGATRPGGRPHAETEALLQAGEQARGATLYVTLEPCSHHGRTLPCAEAIVAAGVNRVVSALEDPDPRVAGRGHQILRQAGISLTQDVCAGAARRAHLGHELRVTRGRPAVTLKMAETADGFCAGGDYDPRLRITDAAANARVHVLRAQHEAILIGAGTARADDPLLTVRLPGMEARKPLRVVLDTRASLSLRSRLVLTAPAWPVLVIAGKDAPDRAVQALRDAGVSVERIALEERSVSLSGALELLARRGATRVLCEGGPTLASNLILRGLVEEALLFRSPRPLGRPGLPSLSQDARDALALSASFVWAGRGVTGADSWERFERVL